MQQLLTLLDEPSSSWTLTEATWSPYALVLSLQVQWHTETTTLQHWQIVCREPRQHALGLGNGAELRLRDDHPLLWQNDRSWYTTFTGATEQPELVVDALRQVHHTLSGGVMPLTMFINTRVALERLLAGPAGLLAVGPAPLMEAYAAVLRDHGFHAAAQQSVDADDTPAGQVLVYETETNTDCFVVASEFEAVCLHAPASTFASRDDSTIASAVDEQRAIGHIDVWRIGSPHDGDLPTQTVPEALRADAMALNVTLDLHAYRSSAFAAQFFCAWEVGALPDIIATGNYLNIESLKRDSAAAQLLEPVHDSLSDLGDFVFQVRTSPNYQAARQLALRRPAVPMTELCETLGSADAAPLETIAAQAVRAYVAGDTDALQRLADAQRIGYDRMGAASSGADTIETHVVAAARLPQLIFIRSVVIFEGPSGRGWQHVLTVWRRHNHSWRLLVISNDPLATREFFPAVTDLVPRAQEDGQLPSPAQLSYPVEGGSFIRPRSGYGVFEDFVWQPSTSPDVLAEVVEVDFTTSGNRLFLFVRDGEVPVEQRLSAGQLWGYGRDRWRVWSIGVDGRVTLSETRTFEH
jgi:hypothetical protein